MDEVYSRRGGAPVQSWGYSSTIYCPDYRGCPTLVITAPSPLTPLRAWVHQPAGTMIVHTTPVLQILRENPTIKRLRIVHEMIAGVEFRVQNGFRLEIHHLKGADPPFTRRTRPLENFRIVRGDIVIVAEKPTQCLYAGGVVSSFAKLHVKRRHQHVPIAARGDRRRDK